MGLTLSLLLSNVAELEAQLRSATAEELDFQPLVRGVASKGGAGEDSFPNTESLRLGREEASTRCQDLGRCRTLRKKRSPHLPRCFRGVDGFRVRAFVLTERRG